MPGSQDHLLIDGYNVIHAWPSLQKLLNRSVDAARSQLIETVRVIRDTEGLRLTLVFDGRGTQPEVEHPGEDPGFTVLYAPADLSADGLIEQIVRRARTPARCLVVSRDNLVIESIRATGAFGYTPEDLEEWIARCEERRSRSLSRHRHQLQKDWQKESNPWNRLPGLGD